MIIRRYITKETLKAQLAIIFVLFIILFSQKLIRILSSTIDGDIPSSLIAPFLLLGVSNIIDIVLPLSLFLAILVTFSRFHNDSEMTAMYACGIPKKVLYQSVAILSLISSVAMITNTTWFGPWSNVQQEHLAVDAKLNPSLAGLLAGKFQQSPQGDAVIYISSANKNNINDIFIAQLSPSQGERPSLILADKGVIKHDESGNQIILLENANRYEGTAKLKNFRISSFHNYQAIIKSRDTPLSEESSQKSVEQLSFKELRQLKTAKAKAEYYWRISLIISVPLMAFLVIPLSASNPRQGRLARILPAILFYLVYFLLESSVKANAAKGRLDPTLWFNLVNGSYLIIAIILNFWDSIFMRQIRYNFRSLRFGLKKG